MFTCVEKNHIIVCKDGAKSFMCVREDGASPQCTAAFESHEPLPQWEQPSAAQSPFVLPAIVLAVLALAFAIKKTLAR